MIAIRGNTYPVKDQLKAIGAKWNPDQKAWMISEDKAGQAQEIVVSAPQTKNSIYRPHKCKVCGVIPRRNSRGYAEPRIYRSGECQDCFEERKMGY